MVVDRTNSHHTEFVLHMVDQVPPGLHTHLQDTKYTVEIQGGLDDWMDYPSVKKFTNAFIIDEKNRKV